MFPKLGSSIDKYRIWYHGYHNYHSSSKNFLFIYTNLTCNPWIRKSDNNATFKAGLGLYN